MCLCTVLAPGGAARTDQSGGATPNITIPLASSNDDGYLASSDYDKFTKKVDSTTVSSATQKVVEIVTLTQAEYNAIVSPLAARMYVII